jgi:glycerol-3-phosphate dehydrogenase subunit B
LLLAGFEAVVADPANRKFDLIVIGSGLAGIAATCFAVARGLKTAQVSATGGELAFASGLLDLLGVYPPHEQRPWDDPWGGIVALVDGSSHHPYARLGVDTIREALQEFLTFLDEAGLRYCALPDHNVTLVTVAGTLKTTYRMPQSMWRGVFGLQEKISTLLIDFDGMKEFSAKLMVDMLRPRWSALRAQRIPFPLAFPDGDRQNPLLAQALESLEVRAALADAIRPHLADAQLVGMPAVLGLRTTADVISDLEDRLGVGIFEIPTLPPSVPGIRLREAIELSLLRQGGQLSTGRPVIAVQTEGRRCIGIITGTAGWREPFEGEGVILATGRFLGGGLLGGRNGIWETVFDLPVNPTTHQGIMAPRTVSGPSGPSRQRIRTGN